MFSVGIFTTHLPYIAFVVFYAYFLFFGVEKVSKEGASAEKYIKIEIETEDYYAYSNLETNFYFDYNYEITGSATLENHVFNRKLKHPDFIYSQFWQECYCFSILSRPPPTV